MNNNSITAQIRTSAVALLGVLMSGCYLLRGAQGQWAVMAKRESIVTVINRPSTPARVRGQLEAVTAIREFAIDHLGLPDNGSYRSYADLKRPYVVWNVFAAPEFSLQPKVWCYPIVGCVAYHGYFSEKRARSFATQLKSRGFDVTVGGSAAYSTLGHFNDPILNTMLGWSDIQLASIIFHELTHQLLYVANDAAFNEALATMMEEEGVRRWLVATGRIVDLQEFIQAQVRYDKVLGLLIAARGQLAALYVSGQPPVAMRETKRGVFAKLHEDYEHLQRDQGRLAFSGLFSAEINNADLVSVATYRNCVPGFERELAAVGGDLAAFFGRVRELAKLPRKQRDAVVCSSV